MGTLKILVLSDTPWSNNNSFGNSYSNIFEGIENIEVANIACRDGRPTSFLVKRYFQITEGSLLRNLKNKAHPSGMEMILTQSVEGPTTAENNRARNFGRQRRWQILFWARDLIWKLGHWKSNELKAFLDSYDPDIIFQPVYFAGHMNDIAQFIKSYTQKPMIGYISDDCYTLKQFSLSPLYWIDRLIKRRKVKKTIEQCQLLYVISEVQKREYEKLFKTPCKILTKCADFQDENKPSPKQSGDVLKMVYAGNISKGRYEILKSLAEATEKCNQQAMGFALDIYTLTPLTKKQKAELSRQAVRIHPPVSYDEILRIQKDSDILIHAEGFSLKERLAVHQSFSTKIVDFLQMNRCIFAVGSDYCASIQYFMENGCAAVACRKDQILEKMQELYSNRQLLQRYADCAWECGKRYHHKAQIQAMVSRDIYRAYQNHQKGEQE